MENAEVKFMSRNVYSSKENIKPLSTYNPYYSKTLRPYNNPYRRVWRGGGHRGRFKFNPNYHHSNLPPPAHLLRFGFARPQWTQPQRPPHFHINNTPFFTDDHQNSDLYFSFETEDKRPAKSIISSLSDRCPDFVSLESFYEPNSPDYNGSFYEQDFERTYRNAREEELLNMKEEELVVAYEKLEQRRMFLDNEINTRDPKSLMAKLQEDLMRLQEENMMLVGRNISLKKDLSKSRVMIDFDGQENQPEVIAVNN